MSDTPAPSTTAGKKLVEIATVVEDLKELFDTIGNRFAQYSNVKQELEQNGISFNLAMPEWAAKGFETWLSLDKRDRERAVMPDSVHDESESGKPAPVPAFAN